MCGWFYTTHTRKVLDMNRQKQYLADNVDSKGNVFPTVGENIRFGSNGSNSPGYPIENLTNFRLLKIVVDNAGIVTLSEDISVDKGSDSGNMTRYIVFRGYSGNNYNIAISSPLMVWIDKSFDGTEPIELYQPYVDIDGYGMGVRNMPNNSHAVFYIADVIRG